MAWQTVLTDPERFFSERRDDPELRGPAFAVLVAGVFGLVSAAPTLLSVLPDVPAEGRRLVGVGVALGVLITIAGQFAVWLVYALLFYGLSAALGGSGEFLDLFALTGWGWVPRALLALVSAVYVVLILGSLYVPAAREAVWNLQHQVPPRTPGYVVGVLRIAVILWSGYLWTYAVATARELSVRRAAVTVGIPLVLSIGWTLARTLGVRLF